MTNTFRLKFLIFYFLLFNFYFLIFTLLQTMSPTDQSIPYVLCK